MLPMAAFWALNGKNGAQLFKSPDGVIWSGALESLLASWYSLWRCVKPENGRTLRRCREIRWSDKPVRKLHWVRVV